VGSVNSQKTKAYGVCYDILVVVGGITARCRFFVLENLSQDVILERPCERLIRVKHDNRDNGSCYTTIYDEHGNMLRSLTRTLDRDLVLRARVVPGIGMSVGSEEGPRAAYTRVFEVRVQGSRARPAGSRLKQMTWARPESRVRRQASGEV